MRPVVAFYTDPCYQLAKHLKEAFQSISNFRSSYRIKNSIDQTLKLRNKYVQNRSVY